MAVEGARARVYGVVVEWHADCALVALDRSDGMVEVEHAALEPIGRRLKVDEDRRAAPYGVALRLSRREWRTIAERAAAAGLSVPDFIAGQLA